MSRLIFLLSFQALSLSLPKELDLSSCISYKIVPSLNPPILIVFDFFKTWSLPSFPRDLRTFLY